MLEDQLQWIVEFSINRGKQTEFERLVKKISDIVRRSEPGTRKYEWFLDEKRNRCIVIESYDSSISGLAHTSGEAVIKILPEVLKIAKIIRFDVCGRPTKQLLDELADVKPSVYRFIAGYSR